MSDWRGGSSPQTNVVDKPPSNAADPPHRIRLEAAAIESSLDTLSTLAGAPMKRLPSVDDSGGWLMPIGPSGLRRLGVRPTQPSARSSPYRSPVPPRTTIPFSSPSSLREKIRGLLRGTTPIRSPRVRSRPSIPPRPSLGPPQPQQAYVGTPASSTTNTEVRRAATILLSLGEGIAISAPQRSPTAYFHPRRPATRRPAAAV